MAPERTALAADRLFDLTGRVAVVTGGGTHIGRAIAQGLATFGAAVTIVGRRADVLERTAEELRDQGLDCSAAPCDASDDAAVRACFEGVVEAKGQLDILVANAGVAVSSQLYPNLIWEEYEATLSACLHTAVVSSQNAARLMIPAGRGRIILIGSTHGELGADARLYSEAFTNRAGVSYHVAKGGVINLARAAACELGQHGITVNCLSPGQTPSPGDDPVTVERFAANNPLGRNAVPEDMQGAAILLASDAGAWITGHNLVVDGGWSAW